MSDGRNLIFLIHGSSAHTWWRRLVNRGYSWWRRWSLFSVALRREFAQDCDIREFSWSGINSYDARTKAGSDLAQVIQATDPGFRIHLVGHSHGGNVALAAINQLPRHRVETLVLLASPNMFLKGQSEWLHWGEAPDRVRRIFNLYSPQDIVQCRMVRLASGLSWSDWRSLSVHHEYRGPGHELVANGVIHWNSQLSAHGAMHCTRVGRIVGSLLNGDTFSQAMKVGGLDPGHANSVEDRGGRPGSSQRQQLIFERGDPRPFDLNPASTDVGILFVHGFTASPAEMRPMALVLAQRSGWRCKGILLPGHGTKIEDMSSSGGKAWVDAAEQAYLELRQNCSKVFLAGVSMGAVLCCHVGLRHNRDPKMNGLILMAPAFSVSAGRKALRRFLLPFSRFRNKGDRAADYFLDHRLYSYLQTPLDSAGDVLALGRQAMQQIGQLRHVPALMFAGDLESTVSLSAMHRVANQNPWIRFIRLPRSRHILPLEPDRESMFEACLSFVKECLANGSGTPGAS